MSNSVVDILLPCFNSEKFLNQQIDSIMAQTYPHWRLIIRDDGSSDNTLKIIESYIKTIPEKIVLISDNNTNLGTKKNIEILLQSSTSQYIMFSDHDDIWLSNKIEISLNKMIETELNNPNYPILVHTDLQVVSEDLSIIHKSFFEYTRTKPWFTKDLYYLANHSCVTGCTMIINKLAQKMVLPIPDVALMHDFWFSLVVCQHGKIEHIATPTVLYRQHTSNVLGAQKVDKIYFLKKFRNLKNIWTLNSNVIKTLKIINPKFSYIKWLTVKIQINFSKFFSK